jgi:hypothetical protein
MKRDAYFRVPFVLFSFAVGALLLPAMLRAQSQDSSQSVAEAARRARTQKKKSDKPVKVITDETLQVNDEDVQNATAWQPKPPESAANAAQAAPAAQTSGQGDAETLKKVTAELARLKEKLSDAQKDLDLAQREYALSRESYYSNPNYANDASGKAKLEGIQAQIDSGQQEVAKWKAKLAEQQELVDKLKGKVPG